MRLDLVQREEAKLDYNWGVQDAPNADFEAPDLCASCQLDYGSHCLILDSALALRTIKKLWPPPFHSREVESSKKKKPSR